MFSTTLRSRQPWSTILPNLDMTESTTLTTDLRLPGGISVLLIYHGDDSLEAVKRIDRSIQRGEDEDATFIVFLGSGNRLDSTFVEPAYLIPLSTLQELPRVLERLIRDFKTTTVAQAASKAKSQTSWTPARMLPLMTTTNTHQAAHTTFILHSLFSSLQALAHGANEYSLEILDDVEARGVVNFLDVEFVSGG